MKDVDLAWISPLAPDNNLWSVQTRDQQFYHESRHLKVTQYPDGYLAAIELRNNNLTKVSELEVIQLPQEVVRTNFAWRLQGQLSPQGVLWHHSALIRDPILKEFITNILSDAKIMHSFYSARASQDFHHNEKGGLFAHSLEVSLTAMYLAKTHDLEQREVECAFVCGLLHDIGKIMMFYNTDNNQQKGVNGQHEAFSFMVLAEHLDTLKNQDKVLFEAISATLSARTGHTKHNDYVIETIVRAADRVSAEVNHSMMAFGDQSSVILRARLKPGKQYKRLGAEYISTS
ncbi:MAG: HD domain-containing protein [Pseudomonas sp.]|nr:HD domain-containing protein [Pseudomonas sp.]